MNIKTFRVTENVHIWDGFCETSLKNFTITHVFIEYKQTV